MGIRNALFEIYWGIERVIAPTLRYSQHLYEDFLKSHLQPGTEWLDLGCGHRVLPAWRSTTEAQLVRTAKRAVGTDYSLDSLRRHGSIALRVCADVTKLPFRSGVFDLATANMVVEHLQNPAIVFREVNRVLKPGGVFLIHTPNAAGYTTIIARLIPDRLKNKVVHLLDGRQEEDIFSTFYRANTKRRIRWLARCTGFEVASVKMIVSSAEFVVLPPLVLLELVWIRMLMGRGLKGLRTNIIAVLRKGAEECRAERGGSLLAGSVRLGERAVNGGQD